MLRVGRALRVIPLLFVFIPLACDDDPSIGDIVDSSTPEVDAGALADAGLDTGFGDGPEDAPAENCQTQCSSDMHKVLDCKGATVRTCSDEQGCNPDTGDCVAACESAAVNKGSVGCEFYTTTRVLGCFAAFVANVWTKPIKIEVDVGGTKAKLDDIARIPSGTGLSTTYAPLPGGLLPPGEIAILFLGDLNPNFPRCPAGVAAAESPMKTGTAYHITTDYPAAVHDIAPYGSGTALTSAELLFPTSAWGDNYIAVDPWTSVTSPYNYTLQLIARENATDVTVLPSVDVRTAISGAIKPKGAPFTATLNKGESLTLFSGGLAGSVISATKPVGAWTAGTIFIDDGYCCGDNAHQQIPPVPSLGSEYVGVRYRNRYEGTEESPPWRILGIVDDTTLTYEPAAPPGAPTELKAGQLATFYAPGPFVVRSQDGKHPIYVSAHMTGCGYAGPPETDECRGDPEFVNVPPATQFLSSYTFFTDVAYPETDLVVVRTKGKDGFKDVVLDCAGPLTGWKPTGGSYEYTRVALSRGNFVPQTYAGGTCENGRHEIKSDEPFGITVWGWGSVETSMSAVSYGYPGGQAVRPINTIKVPPVPK